MLEHRVVLSTQGQLQRSQFSNNELRTHIKIDLLALCSLPHECSPEPGTLQVERSRSYHARMGCKKSKRCPHPESNEGSCHNAEIRVTRCTTKPCGLESRAYRLNRGKSCSTIQYIPTQISTMYTESCVASNIIAMKHAGLRTRTSISI